METFNEKMKDYKKSACGTVGASIHQSMTEYLRGSEDKRNLLETIWILQEFKAQELLKLVKLFKN